MNILVIGSNNYPSLSEPQKGTFLYKLVQEFAKNNKVYVFAPEKRFASQNTELHNYGKENATVFRPKFITLSNKNILGFNTYHIGRRGLGYSLKKIYKSIKKVDFVYAHFISNALVGVDALQEFKVPIFAAVGEYNNIDITKAYFKERSYFKLINQVKGFIAVSPQVEEKLFNLNIATRDSCLMAPNGVNRTLFKPSENRQEVRKELNLPLNSRIILFVGRFEHDKGPKRVLEALEVLNNPNFKVVCLGVGPQELKSAYIHFQGAVKNEDVSKYMGAADIFVLPTLHEGSSNVIVEAMATGLPIVSSNIPEIRVQCNSNFSILVDPLDVYGLSHAINTILSNPQRMEQMSLAAREHSKNFDIETRAHNILKFIQARL